MKTIQTPAYAVALLLGTSLFARAQRTEFPYSHQVLVQTGLLQDLVLGGQNIVVSYTTRRMVFDWSYGSSLDLKGGLLSTNPAYEAQKLAIHMPWTVGPSIGYRITPFLNVRAEFKAHRIEANYEAPTAQEAGRGTVAKYTSFEAGAGVFYEYYPFRKETNWTKGILIEPVVRYWPRIGSTLDKDFTYQNTQTGRAEKLPSYQSGLLANINVGYTFGRKQKR